MNRAPNRTQRSVKFISVVVSLSILANQVLFAHAPATTVWQERRTSAPFFSQLPSLDRITDVRRLPAFASENPLLKNLPLQFGTLRDSYKGVSRRRFLIIQDIHLNTEAQANVAGMLRELATRKNLASVAVEGASGPFNFEQFWNAAPSKIVNEVADAFFKSNRIGAVSYAGITAGHTDIPTVGVDDYRLYQANLDAYKTSYRQKSSVSNLLAREKAALALKEQTVFNPSLLKFNRLVESYQAGSLPLGKFVAAVFDANSQAKSSHPVLAAYSQAYRLEQGIDWAQADHERKLIFESLVSKLDRGGVDELIQASIAYKGGQIACVDYYRYLSSLLSRHSISLDRAAAFNAYLRYTALADGINAEHLLGEIRAATDKTLLALATTDEERALLRQARSHGLREKLAGFTLTPEEWEDYRLNNSLGGDLKSFEAFYENAHARSERIVSNLLASGNSTGKLSVLVVGGFHAPEITRLLKQKGIGYAVMTPNITKINTEGGSAYLSIFTREKTPLEKLFEGEKLTMLPATVNAGGEGAFGSMTDGTNRGLRVYLSALRQLELGNEYATVIDGPNQFFVVDGNAPMPAGFQAIPGTAMTIGSHQLLFVRPSQPDEVTWVSRNTPQLHDWKLVEATMEMALPGAAFELLQDKLHLPDGQMRAVAMSNSTGGIGPLLKERVIAEGELGADNYGYSLLYDEVWVQEEVPNNDGTGKKHLEWEKVSVGDDLRKILILDGTLRLKMHNGQEVDVKVWKSPVGMFGKGTVCYFDCPEITTVVYPGKKDHKGSAEAAEAQRLAQSWLLGRGILANLKRTIKEESPRVVVIMSETPSVFADHRLFEDEFTNDPFFKNFIYIFNDHTPLDYAHPFWERVMLSLTKLMPQYFQNPSVWTWIKVRDVMINVVDVTAMVINMAHGVFGVAKKHAEVMKMMPLLRQFAGKIKSVTNGVSAAYWPHPDLRDFENQTDEQLLQHKENERQKLMHWLEKRGNMDEGWAEKMIAGGNPIGVWIRRLVEYKRADRIVDILLDPKMREEFLQSGIVFVLGGRIHQDDPFGINQYNRLQEAFVQEPLLRERLVFLTNYNIWEAPHLFHGQNFSVMLANDGREASATGFQKAQMNGGLIIASSDGAVPESVSFFKEGEPLGDANGFDVPYENFPHANEKRQPTARGLLEALKSFRKVYNDKVLYGQMVRNAMSKTSFVDVMRTAKDQLKFIDSVVERTEDDRKLYRDAKLEAKHLIELEKPSSDKARAILVQLSLIAPFKWKFNHNLSEEREIRTSNPGLDGFVEGGKYVRDSGTLGEWIMFFHSHHQNGRGDIAAYLLNALNGIDELAKIKDQIEEVARFSARHGSENVWRRNGLYLIGLIEGLQETLKEIAAPDITESLVMSVPGASGWAAKTNLSLVAVGFWEGMMVLSVAVPVILLTMYGMPPAIGNTEKIVLLSFPSLLTAFVFIYWIHNKFGVLLARYSKPSFKNADIQAAILVASLSLIGIPFVAAAFVWQQHAMALVFTGVFLSTVPHAIKNYSTSPLFSDELKLATDIHDAREKATDDGSLASALTQLNPLENMQLDQYSTERQELIKFAAKKTVSPARLFLSRSVQKNRRDFKVSLLASELKPGDDVLLVPQSTTKKDLLLEMGMVKNMIGWNGQLIVVLNDVNGHLIDNMLPMKELGVQYIFEKDLNSRQQIENLILGPAKIRSGNLKLVVNVDQVAPIQWLQWLVELGQETKYADMVIRYILVNTIGREEPAVLANGKDMQALLVFLAQA